MCVPGVQAEVGIYPTRARNVRQSRNLAEEVEDAAEKADNIALLQVSYGEEDTCHMRRRIQVI
jgi:hypothetical protein